jgi:hypothetical protein
MINHDPTSHNFFFNTQTELFLEFSHISGQYELSLHYKFLYVLYHLFTRIFLLISLFSLIMLCTLFHMYSFPTLVFKVPLHLPEQTVGTQQMFMQAGTILPTSFYVSTHCFLFKQVPDEEEVSG